MHYVSFVLKNVARRRTRSLLTVVGVAVAVMAVVALVGIARGFETSLVGVFENRGADLVVVRAGSIQMTSSVLHEELGARIGRLPGVREVTPVLLETVSFRDPDMLAVVLQGVPADSRSVRNVRMVTGTSIEPGGGRAVMLGQMLALNLDLTTGQTIEVLEGQPPFRIQGVYQSYNVFENGAMIMALDQLQELMARQGDVTSFSVTAEKKDQSSLEELARRIEALAPGIDARPTRQYIDTSVEIRTSRAAAWLTSTIALVIGTIGMMNTMLTAVFERTRELSLLRAIGWRKKSVVQLILCESVLLAVAGAAVGTAAAVGLVQLLSNMPAAGLLISGEISAEVIGQGVAIAVIVGLAGGVYPAYRAAQLLPTEGLRHE